MTQLLAACTPGYYNNEGHIDPSGGGGRGITEIYALGLNQFNALLAEWRADGRLAGLELDAESGAVPSSSATGTGAMA